MSNRKRANMTGSNRPTLPPIINEEDDEWPFLKPDFFSDVALVVTVSDSGGATDSGSHGAKRPPPMAQTKKLYTARCVLAYNSPVFEKSLTNAKKHEVDMPNKNYDDIVELLCYLDPRVQYTLTAKTAKQLLPLAEEYEMHKLRRGCENVLHAAFDELRKDHRLGQIPPEINEEYLILADRYKFEALLRMCVEEYVHCPNQDVTKSIVNSDTVSEGVKLMILERKLARLNNALEKERKYKYTAENQLDNVSPRKRWTNEFGLYHTKNESSFK